MDCLKCGRQTQEGQVFCSACLQDMEKYPVKPGTTVQLPIRTSGAPARKPSRKARTAPPEEQVRQLRGLVRRLTAAVAALALALCVTAAVLAHALITDGKADTVGRNYTTVNTGQQP